MIDVVDELDFEIEERPLVYAADVLREDGIERVRERFGVHIVPLRVVREAVHAWLVHLKDVIFDEELHTRNLVKLHS